MTAQGRCQGLLLPEGTENLLEAGKTVSAAVAGTVDLPGNLRRQFANRSFFPRLRPQND